jgi:DNA-binding CsgD family transcriptional regulator
MGLARFEYFPHVADEVEALIGVGRTAEAVALIDVLDANGRHTGNAWTRMVTHRYRGMVAGAIGDRIQAMLELERSVSLGQEGGSSAFEFARTLLALGTTQRRFKQRRDARGSFEAAAAIFSRLGAPVWAERARVELARAAGAAAGAELTETETRVAELVGKGMTNREIADALFVSVKTVEANLSRIFGKLGVRSRRDVARRLGRESTELRDGRSMPDDADAGEGWPAWP